MPDPLRTTVSQFSSSGGRAQMRAVNVRAVEPAPDLPGANRGSLYVLVEVTGSGGGHAALYRQILNAIQTAFYELGDSVEAGLRQAVRSAHFVLRRANEALPEANWRAGLSCVAVRDGEAIIAQAGPALVLISHPQTVDQFAGGTGDAALPLGGQERPTAELFHTTVEPGSMLLLAQSDWLKQVTPEALAIAVAAESVSLATHYLQQLAGEADLSALLVGFSVAAEAEGPAEEEGLPEGEAILAEPPVEAAPPTRPWQSVATEQAESLAFRPPAAPAPRSEPAAASTAPSRRAEALPRPGQHPAQPSPRPPARKEEAQPEKRSPWLLLLALIGVPLLIAAVVLGMLWFRAREADARFDQTLSGAAAALQEAQTIPDEGRARARLDAAREFLEEARKLRPTDTRLAKLQTQYNDVSGRINKITPLYGVTPLWEFREAGRRLKRIVPGGDSLFVLDEGRQEVLRFVLSQLRDSVTPAEPPVVLRKGDKAGDVVIGDLVDITWLPATGNQRSRLAAPDAAGGLATYDVTWALNGQTLAGREQWGLPQFAVGYGGNLYVVDVRANQIWRYRPTDKGYTLPPERYFAATTPVDLTGLQSVAINGDVWLLYADGRLLKYFVGEQKPFEIRGLPNPLRTPMAVVAPPEGDFLYIGDAGNGRIVEVTKQGQFSRQFRAADERILRDMRSLAMDEAGSAFYILTSDKLYRADLPQATASTASPPAAPPAQ